MGTLATLIPIAEECGGASDASAQTMRDHLRARLEQWLNPRDATGASTRKTPAFYYDRNWGTLIGYPASFGSDQELNDHHFHYGYFLKAAGFSESGRIRRFYWKIESTLPIPLSRKDRPEIPGDNKRGANVL